MQYVTGDSPLKILGLSVRTYNAMNRIGIDTVGKLLTTPIDELLKARNLGRKNADDIRHTIDDIRNGKNGILFISDSDEWIKQHEVQIETVNLFQE